MLAVSAAVLLVALAGCQSYVRRVDLAEEYFNLGNAFYELEDYERAADYYQQALDLEPELAPASFNLARAYIESGDYAEAVAILEELRGGDEDNVLVLESLAYAHSQQGRYERAATRYEEVLATSPYRVSALYSAALVYGRLEETERARELLERAWDANPNDADVLFHYGRVLHEAGESEEAVSVLSDYVDAAPAEQADRLNEAARIYADERYFARAVSVYDRILARDETNPEALFGIAVLQLTAIEDAASGVENLTAALEAGFSEEERAVALLEREDLLSRTQVAGLFVDYGLIEPDEGADAAQGGEQDDGVVGDGAEGAGDDAAGEEEGAGAD